MSSYDDDYDSDDSGFGFDDGLSTDQVLLNRIAKMRSMMTLATDSHDDPPPSKAPVAVPAPVTAPVLVTASVPVTATPPPPLPKETPVADAPVAVEDKEEKHEDTQATITTASSTATEQHAEEDEFLLVDRVQTLALSQHKETEKEAQAATVAPPAAPPVAPPTAGDDEGEFGAEDVEVDGEDEESEDDEDDGYVITWARGQLGLLFKAGPRGETVIRRINKKTSSAEGLHVARVGDVLVAINHTSVSGRAFQEINEQLRLPDFPVTLTFQPLKLSDDDNDTGASVRTSRSSDQDMLRKESSVSVLSSTSSANAPPAAPTPIPELGPSPVHQLNHVAPSHAPPPSYSKSYTLDDDDLMPGEYDVVWRQGALGCGIKQRNGLPTVKSVTPGAAVDPSVQQIAPGDVMILVNGMDTEAIGFRAVVDTMQRAPKPLYMRFRRASAVAAPLPPPPPPPVHVQPPSQAYAQPPPPAYAPRPSRYDNNEIENLRESRFDVEDAAAGSLNPRQYTVLWKDGPLGVQIKPRPSDGAIVVTKFTGTGNPELLSAITIGDVFVRIAGVNVADMGISGTYEKLKSVHKPVPLVFERPAPQLEATVPPPPPPPPPMPAVRQGFAADDMSDSATVVPSFRELREREAAANQGRNRGSFSGFSAEQRAEDVVGATVRRAVLARQRPASYDTFDVHDPPQDGPRSRHSFPQAENANGDGRFQDRASDPSHQVGDTMAVERGPAGADTLPRFSDIEMGRVKTTALTSLPPPPAYHETFSQSGRFLDPSQFAEAAPPPPSPSPAGDGRQGTSVSPGQERWSQAQPGPPPAYGPAYGYTLPTPPPAARVAPPYSMPTPPSYDQYGGNYNPRNGGGDGGYGGSHRIDYMRQQYIESERMRNQPFLAGGREGAMTEMSTYSDLDDSGIMAAMRRPADRMRTQASPNYGPPPPVRPSLPTPELWIQWSEGPLGITFRRTNGQIVVSRLTGAGYSRGLEQIRAGDWLVSFGNTNVGTYSTSELRLAETMELIKTLPKPVDMRFVVR